RGVRAEAEFDPGWEIPRQPLHLRQDAVAHVERVGGRQLEDAEAHARAAVEAQQLRIVLGAELGAPHVANADELAVLAALHDDVVELVRFDEATARPDGDLERLIRPRRGLPDLARGDLEVLLLQGPRDVLRRQPAPRQRGGIEPDAHGELTLAEDANLAHAADALER